MDDPVARYWPEFAANGKDDVTVRHLLSHSAGLHRLRSVIDRADRMLDWEYMVDALAAAPPAYEAGTAAGYHALTFGWLVGEVVRRVSGQPVDAFIQQEIVSPLELDGCWVGLPHDQRHRLAPLAPFMSLPNVNLGPAGGAAKWLNRQAGKAVSAVGSPVNPRRIMNALVPRGIEDVFVDDELLGAELPALNGCFTGPVARQDLRDVGRVRHDREDHVDVARHGRGGSPDPASPPRPGPGAPDALAAGVPPDSGRAHCVRPLRFRRQRRHGPTPTWSSR